MDDILYFGCWDRVGHTMRRPDGSSVRSVGDMPWGIYGEDGKLPPQVGPQVEGLAATHHLEGWTALSFWDRSVDDRMGCNSNFFLRGTYDFAEAVSLARAAFPHVWARFKFDVVAAPLTAAELQARIDKAVSCLVCFPIADPAEVCENTLDILDPGWRTPNGQPRESVETDRTMLLNLLAVIHGDGGHHSDEVGVAQSVADAHQVWAAMKTNDSLVASWVEDIDWMYSTLRNAVELLSDTVDEEDEEDVEKRLSEIGTRLPISTTPAASRTSRIETPEQMRERRMQWVREYTFRTGEWDGADVVQSMLAAIEYGEAVAPERSAAEYNKAAKAVAIATVESLANLRYAKEIEKRYAALEEACMHLAVSGGKEMADMFRSALDKAHGETS